MNNNTRKDLGTKTYKIVSGILTAVLIFGGLIVLLPISSDTAEGYTLPSGAYWDMDTLVANSGGAVTGSSGTYQVHEDIYVSYNSTLFVDPGETIYFDTYTGLNISGNFWAMGYSNDMLTFTSSATSPKSGDWDGITFYGGYGFISNAGIYYAEKGVYIVDTFISVNNSIFSENHDGIVIGQGGGADSTNNHFSNQTGSGILLEYGVNPSSNYNLYVYDCDFIHNSRAGIQSTGTYGRVEVYDSYFDGNDYGVKGGYWTLQITDSEIVNSNLYDLDLSNYAIATTLNTTFDDNSVLMGYNSTLEVQWYLHILVINAMGPVPSADVTVSDNANGSWSQGYTSDAQGRVKWIVVTEYIRDKYALTYYTPHDITAQKGSEIGYADPYMDESKFVTVDISNGTPPPNQSPIADAGPDQIVFEDEIVNFDGSGSYDPDGVIVNYTWNFGDGNFGYGEFPTHIYDTPGSYDVTLTVIDDDNATDSDGMKVTVELKLPRPPRDLDAILVPGSLEDVKLIWTASQDDGEGDNNVAGYTVYKSSDGIYGNYNFAAWIPAQKIPSHTYEWTDFDAGDGDTNNYFYVVRANDTSDDEEQNNNRVGKFAKDLVEGWNLISVPLIQSDTSRGTVLQTLEGNYWAVQGYHAGKSRPWLNWHRDKPNYFNDVIEVNHKDGYYVDMLVADSLVTAGKVASQEQITLKSGWNLVGYPLLTEKTRDTALSSISGNYNMVERFDTTSDKEVRLKSGDSMEPGLAYWIHATNDCTWTIMN